MTHKNRFTYPLRYIRNYAMGLFNQFCMGVAKIIASEERIAESLLMQGLEWKKCNGCGWHFFFNAPYTEQQGYCHICSEHIIFYQCLECDRKMFFDSRRKDVKVIDGMFCEYHIDGVSQNIIDANQMFIDFRKVSSISSEEAYAKLHEKHKEDFAKQVSNLPLSEKELNELGFEKPQEGDASDVIEFNTEPATQAEQKALDKINRWAGHKKDKS